MRLRADRTGGVHDELFLAAETDLGAVLTHIEQVRPTLLVVDSIQTIGAPGIEGVPGGVTQVKEVAAALIRVAKTRNITTVLVGHVTKDGSIAGPRVLEHLVDVVLHFEGDRNSRFRMVRAMKNRFGPVDEVGCFDLSAERHHRGHRPDRPVRRAPQPAGARHLRRRHHGGPPAAARRGAGAGDALAARAPAAHDVGPRLLPGGDGAGRARSSTAGIRLHAHDVFASTVGGARLTEPATDLAVAVAIASAPPAAWPRPRGSWRWARSGWPASCAGCATCRSAWPRRPGSASRSRWCRGSAHEPETGSHRMVDGLRVISEGTVCAARCSDRCGVTKADHPRLRPLD